jgi:hypothetical protein
MIKNCLKKKIQFNIKNLEMKILSRKITKFKKKFILDMTVCLKKLNLSKLLKENFFTVFNKLAFNEYIIFINSLTDSKANDLIFIDSQLIVNMIKFFNIYLI